VEKTNKQKTMVTNERKKKLTFKE